MRTMTIGTMAGLAVGAALLGAASKLPTPERAEAQLEAGGADEMSGAEARAKAAPILLMTAGAIGGGYLRRGATGTHFGPAIALGAAALVAGPGVSTFVNSGTNPDNYMAATGIAGIAATAGYAAGVGTSVPVRLAKGAGIAMAVAGAVLYAPSVIDRVGSDARRLRAGFQQD